MTTVVHVEKNKWSRGEDSNLRPNQNALLKLQNFLLPHFDFSINSSIVRTDESVCWLLVVPIHKGFIEGVFKVLSHGDGLVGGRMRFWYTAFQRFHQAVKIRILEKNMGTDIMQFVDASFNELVSSSILSPNSHVILHLGLARSCRTHFFHERRKIFLPNGFFFQVLH